MTPCVRQAMVTGLRKVALFGDRKWTYLLAVGGPIFWPQADLSRGRSHPRAESHLRILSLSRNPFRPIDAA